MTTNPSEYEHQLCRYTLDSASVSICGAKKAVKIPDFEEATALAQHPSSH